MTRGPFLACCGAVAAWFTLASSAHAAPLGTSNFRLYLPAFAGEQPLGLNVATVINLRIWRTLRMAPSPNPKNLNFGSGTVIWDPEAMDEPVMPEAAVAIRYGHFDMVLIGSAERYGDGVIAQTSLVVRPLAERDAPGGALWRVGIGGRTIELGLPRQTFEFGTMVLRPEIIAEYSRPSAVTLCPAKTSSCNGKELGPSFAAHVHEGDWSYVESRTGGKGWVLLKQLGREPNETVEFVGGLVSYFRGDMAQADTFFGKAAATAAADSIVRQDARVLQAAARSRLGAMAAGDFDEVLAGDPYSRYALQAAVMDALQRYSRDHGGLDRLRRLAASVRNSRDLFEANDPWLAQAEAIFETLNL